MNEKISSESTNIDANVGCLNGLDFQENGTERFKGSHPKLITDPDEILDQLSTDLPPMAEEYGNRVSRLSSRYFATRKGLYRLDQMLNEQQIGGMSLQLEAAIPLGKIFQEDGIEDDILWLWVGGNNLLRKTDPKIMGALKRRFQNSMSTTTPYACSPPEGHKLLLLGTPNRLKALKDGQIPAGASPESVYPYAEHIAKLYDERLKVYVADNGNPKYIAEVVADSEDTTLFAIVNPHNEIEALTANEFTRYPVKFPDGTDRKIVICEVNDIVRRRGANKQSLMAVITAAMIDAVSKTHGVEIECVPEAFEIAGRVGFQPMGVLERTSHMITDGANIELHDQKIPEEFRQFNSLFLYGMGGPLNPSWNFWKNYSKAA